ncbi:MAG TPA: hybrid sensor histidine kinase/response regulator [Gemmatimonadales bacterium]|nr:hybrid sensor histidine kinase/response regulator [Gemmatimonadales bacterium]
MALWIPFAFGGVLGALLGFLVGRQRGAARRRPAIAVASPPQQAPRPSADGAKLRLDQGAANVLNALNNRLAAISALSELLQSPGPEPERARALDLLQSEVRRAAEITGRFMDLATNPLATAEPANVEVVLAKVLRERDVTLRELGVKVVRSVAPDLPPVACPPPQLDEMLTRLADFSLRRLRESAPPREFRVTVAESGPSVSVALSDSGAPLSAAAEQRLVSPFRFAQGGGGEIEFALARALAQSSGGTLRLRPRGDGAEVVVTLPKRPFAAAPAEVAAKRTLPKLRILVVDDDGVNRDALRRLLEREGHDVVAVENGVEAIERLGTGSTAFDAIVTDLQMPRLGGRALWEQVADERPQLARRFVFVTGDRARDETQRFLEESGQPAVLKPYELGDLVAAIGKVAQPR